MTKPAWPDFFGGKLAGLAVGLLVGPVAIPFGLLIGALLDAMVAEHLLSRRMRLFVCTAEYRKLRPAQIMAAIGAVLWIQSSRHHANYNTAEFESLLAAHGKGRSVLLFRKVLEIYSTKSEKICLIPMLEVGDRMLDSLLCEEIRRFFVGGDGRGGLVAIPEILAADGFDRRGSQEERAKMTYQQACRILGLSPRASVRQVKAGYRRLAAQFHPDTVLCCSEEQQAEVAEAFRKITTAYDVVVASQLEMRAPTELSRETRSS